MRPKYAIIVCPGHSGSTLLGMCLNSHSKIHTFGEFASLRSRIERIESGNKAGLCSFCYEDCRVLDERETRRIRRRYYSRSHKASYAKSVLTHPLYVRQLAVKTHSEVICDTSKSAMWAIFLSRYMNPTIDLRYIFLFRDPRAVAASHLRKGREISTAVEKCKGEINRMFQLQEGLQRRGRSDRFVEIRYEAFVKEPERALEELCKLVGLQFEKSMLDYDQYEHHIVGGNDKARSRIKLKNNQRINYNKKDIDWYLNQKEKLFVDERWKTELSEQQKATVEKELRNEMQRLEYAA